MAGNEPPRRAGRRMFVGAARFAALLAVITGVGALLAPDLTQSPVFYGAAAIAALLITAALSRTKQIAIDEPEQEEAGAPLVPPPPMTFAPTIDLPLPTRVERQPPPAFDLAQITSKVRDEERQRWSNEVARSVDAVRRGREELSESHAAREVLEREVQQLGIEMRALQRQLDEQRAAANAQVIRADSLVAELNRELTEGRSAVERAAANEIELRKQFAAEIDSVKRAATSALEEIDRSRAKEQTSLRAQAERLETEYGEKMQQVVDGLTADHERDREELTERIAVLERTLAEERTARERAAGAAADLQNQIATARAQDEEAERRTRAVHEQLEAERAARQDLAARLESERASLEQASGATADLQREIAAARQSRDEAARHFEEAKRAFELERTARVELEQRIESLRREAEQALAAKDGDWNAKLQTIVAGMAADHENDIGTATEQREVARAEARSLTSRVQELLRMVEVERAKAVEETRAAKERLDAEWGEKLQKIVAGIAADHENATGDFMMEREAARAEVRSLTQKLTDMQESFDEERATRTRLEGEWSEKLAATQQSLEDERATRARLETEWDAKLQKIVAGITADHENAIGDYTMEREAAKAEARSLTQKLGEMQRKLEEERATRTRLENEWNEKLQTIVAGITTDHENNLESATVERETARAEARHLTIRLQEMQRDLDAARAKPVDETALRATIDAEWSAKLQTIVHHIASDHEADVGKALEEKEEAKAATRVLEGRVASLEKQVDLSRQTLLAAEQKFNAIRESLVAKADSAQREVEMLRSVQRARPMDEPLRPTEDLPLPRGEELSDPFESTVVPTPAPFPSPFTDEERARADVLEFAEQAHAVLRRTGPGTMALPAIPRGDRRSMILFVHHDPNMRTMWRDQLHKAGYDVITAADGLEGLRLATAHKPDVVIADAQMPKMDGRELCQMIKSNRETATVKVVLMSGMYTAEMPAPQSEEFAPDEMLRKPVKLDALQTALANVLG